MLARIEIGRALRLEGHRLTNISLHAGAANPTGRQVSRGAYTLVKVLALSMPGIDWAAPSLMAPERCPTLSCCDGVLDEMIIDSSDCAGAFAGCWAAWAARAVRAARAARATRAARAAGAVGAGGAAGTGAAAERTGAVPTGSGGATRPRPYFVPLLEQVLGLPLSPGPAPVVDGLGGLSGLGVLGGLGGLGGFGGSSESLWCSSCEAEIYAGAMAAQELRWLTYLLTDLGEQPRSPPVLYVDNKAMLALCREHRLEHKTKHIALRYFLARELQQRGQLRLAYVASEANTADIFTKALAPGDHQRFCTMLGLVPTWPHLLTS
ncbi:unnamed protein product [Closterium sp. NIES-53]